MSTSVRLRQLIMPTPTLAVWPLEPCGVPEAVSGDLLEAYRAGRSRWWLWRQALHVIGVAMLNRHRLVLGWSLVVFVAAAGRTLLDTFVPPLNYGPRSAVTTFVAIGTTVVAGFHAAFRTGRIRSGPWLTIRIWLLGQAATAIFTLVLFVTVIAADRIELNEFQVTGGFDEVFLLPIMVLPINALIGTLGGMLGRVAHRLRLGALSTEISHE